MKMKRVLILFCVAGFVGWCLSGCDPIQSHSEIPEIGFKSLVFEDRIDTMGILTKKAPILTFSFIDGDGDLGRSPEDVDRVSRIHYTWYQKLPDGTYVQHQFPDGTITISPEIPYDEVMNKEGANNKTLKGTIEIVLIKPTNTQGVDIMRVEFFIVDRASNQSNVEYTPDFSILNPPEEPLLKTKAAK